MLPSLRALAQRAPQQPAHRRRNVAPHEPSRPVPPKKSLLQSYLAIPPTTRITLGLVAMGVALVGLYVADELEERYPASQEEKDRLAQSTRFNVRLVDHEEREREKEREMLGYGKDRI